MSIENKIRQIAKERFSEYSYIFEDWNGADKAIGKVSFPAIIFLLPPGGHLDFSRGKVKDSEDVAIAFVDKVSRDADGYDNEQVYSRMKKTAGKFINAMNESRHFEPIDGNVKYSTILEDGADYFTGVFIELSIKEISGVCL